MTTSIKEALVLYAGIICHFLTEGDLRMPTQNTADLFRMPPYLCKFLSLMKALWREGILAQSAKRG